METASRDPTLEALEVRKTYNDGSVTYGTLFDECTKEVKQWNPEW